MWKLLTVASLIFFVGCGKNEAVRPVGNSYPQPQPTYPYPGPVNQAPLPPGGGYFPPTSPYYPPGGNFPVPPQPMPVPVPVPFPVPQPVFIPYFIPVMPMQMPVQYYPWLPIDNYFRQSPQTTQVWINIWDHWQGYANYNNVNVYDFNTFWLDYCPQYWNDGNYGNLYNYFDNSAYNWVNPNTQWAANPDPGYFWQNYSGMSYSGVDYSCYDCWGGYW